MILMSEEKQEDGSTKLVEKERRRVNMVLSARSCGLEEPFTEDIQEKSEYWVQRKPKRRERVRDVVEIVKERIAAIQGKKSKKEIEEEESRERMLD